MNLSTISYGYLIFASFVALSFLAASANASPKGEALVQKGSVAALDGGPASLQRAPSAPPSPVDRGDVYGRRNQLRQNVVGGVTWTGGGGAVSGYFTGWRGRNIFASVMAGVGAIVFGGFAGAVAATSMCLRHACLIGAVVGSVAGLVTAYSLRPGAPIWQLPG